MDILKNLFKIAKQKTTSPYRKGIHCFNKLEYLKSISYFEQVIEKKSPGNSLEANLAHFYCGRAHLNVGVTYFANSKNKKALHHFQKALRFYPEDTDLDYFIGICLNNIGDYEGAMASFSKILKTEPWNIPTKLKIAVIFHNMKLWSNAEEIHRQILAKNPNFADVHYHLGLALMSQAKPEEAADAFSTALAINPNYTEARIKLSIVQICMDNYKQALENLKWVAQANPGYADVYYLISIVKEKENAPDEAIYYLNQSLKLNPKFKNAIVKLIIALCRKGDREAAQDQIRKAFEFYPNDKRLTSIQKTLKIFDPEFNSPSDKSEIALSLQKDNSIKELRHEFHKDLDIMPNVSEIITMFKSTMYTQKEADISNFLIPFITEQINRTPTYPDLYNSLGLQLLTANKSIEAENAFTKALELNPEYISARINLMKILHQQGKDQEAYDQGKKLLPKNLPFPDLYLTLTEVLFSLNRYDEALLNAKRVLRLRPSMAEAILLTAKIYGKKGENKRAIRIIEEYLEEDQPSLQAKGFETLLKNLTNISILF